MMSIALKTTEIIECRPADRLDWDAFVETTPASTIAHAYCWREAIASSYGHRTYYLMARRDGFVKGILPLVWVKGPFFGNTLASMPFQDYGGIVALDEPAADALLQHALKLRDNSRTGTLELRHKNPGPCGKGIVRRDKATLMLDLSPGAEMLWKQLPPKVRNQVRKAEKSGLTTTMGGSELLNEFYQVFAINMRDLGSPVHSRTFLNQVLAKFGDNARLLVARDGHKVIGGLFCLFYKNEIVVPWASSLRSYFAKCPNNLLYWRAIQFASERGCTLFDFGRSTIGSGTYNFKTQWGAVPVPLHWQIFPSHEGASIIAEADYRYRISAKIWGRLPVALTVLLGPCIRKYLAN